MGAGLHDASLVEDIDSVGGADAGEAVRDKQHSMAGEQSPDEREQLVLRPGVEGGGGLVEDDKRRVAKEGSSECYALPLAGATARKATTTLATPITPWARPVRPHTTPRG